MLKKMTERVSTGIHGLDELVQGGFVKGSVNLVGGKAGTGKTAFCSSFLYQGAIGGEPGLYVTTEERENDIKEDIKTMFSWDLESLEKEHLIKFLSIHPILPNRTAGSYNTSELVRLYIFKLSEKIEKGIRVIGAKRVVIDSVSMIEMFVRDEYLARVALMQLTDKLKNLGITSLLSGTIPETSDALSGGGIVEYIVDSVIKMDLVPVAEEFKRTLLIRKMRRTNHSTHIHPLNITPDGLSIAKFDGKRT